LEVHNQVNHKQEAISKGIEHGVDNQLALIPVPVPKT